MCDKFTSCCSKTSSNCSIQFSQKRVLALPVLMGKLEPQHKKKESSLEMQQHPTHILLCAACPHPQIHNRGIPAILALQMANPLLCHFGLSPERIIPHGFFYMVRIYFLGRMDVWAWKISAGMNNGEIAFIN